MTTVEASNGSPNTVSAKATIAPGSPLSPSVADVATGVIRPSGRCRSPSLISGPDTGSCAASSIGQ